MPGAEDMVDIPFARDHRIVGGHEIAGQARVEAGRRPGLGGAQRQSEQQREMEHEDPFLGARARLWRPPASLSAGPA